MWRSQLCWVQSFKPSSRCASASLRFTSGPTTCPCGSLACHTSIRRWLCHNPGAGERAGGKIDQRAGVSSRSSGVVRVRVRARAYAFCSHEIFLYNRASGLLTSSSLFFALLGDRRSRVCTYHQRLEILTDAMIHGRGRREMPTPQDMAGERQARALGWSCVLAKA